MHCYVCTELCPVPHEHHKDPQALGGADWDQEEVCPTCHQLIHTAAYKLLKSQDAAVALVTTKFQIGSQKYRRCVELVIRVARKMQAPDPVETKRVTLVLPVKTIRQLKEQAVAAGVGYLEYSQEILKKQSRRSDPFERNKP